jgi:polyhydroxyalkanoate synthesis regulator phasin
MYDVVRKALLASLGVQEKVKELLDDLVKKGELNEREGAKLMKEWVDKAESQSRDVNKMFTEGVSKGYEMVNIASKEELDKLAKKVQQLSLRVKKLEGGTQA